MMAKVVGHNLCARRAGFTLAELLAVMLIISLLMTASIGSFFRARELARHAKAEAQLREMVNAWSQYYTTYCLERDASGKNRGWPRAVAGRRDEPVTAAMLAPLTDPDNAENEYGIVFLNYTGTGEYRDPWGSPYRMTWGAVSDGVGQSDRGVTKQETTIALPARILPE